MLIGLDNPFMTIMVSVPLTHHKDAPCQNIGIPKSCPRTRHSIAVCQSCQFQAQAMNNEVEETNTFVLSYVALLWPNPTH